MNSCGTYKIACKKCAIEITGAELSIDIHKSVKKIRHSLIQTQHQVAKSNETNTLNFAKIKRKINNIFDADDSLEIHTIIFIRIYIENGITTVK